MQLQILFRRFVFGLGTIIIAWAGPADLCHSQVPQNAAQLAVLSRFDRLQNWTARFVRETTTDFDPAIQRQSRIPTNRHDVQTVLFRFRNGTVKVQSELDEIGKQAAEREETTAAPFEIRMISAERTEHLRGTHRGAGAGAIIADPGQRSRIPSAWTLDIGLGLRLVNDMRWLQEADLNRADIVEDDEGITMSIENGNEAISTMRFERRFGYALASYRIDHGTDDFEEIRCSDFRVIDGIYLPFKMIRIGTYRDSGGVLRNPRTITISVQEYILNDPSNTRDNMLITWPATSRVLDARTGTQVPVGPTSRPLTDEAIAEEILRQQRSAQNLEQRARERVDRNTGGSTRGRGQ